KPVTTRRVGDDGGGPGVSAKQFDGRPRNQSAGGIGNNTPNAPGVCGEAETREREKEENKSGERKRGESGSRTKRLTSPGMHSITVIPRHEPAGQIEAEMTKSVWHRHSCRCLFPQEGRFGTGKSTSTPPGEAPVGDPSACATQTPP